MLTAAALLIAIPAVVLSAEHQAMTRVEVGQAFPTIEGQNPDGQATKVADKLGPKATVVAVPGGAKWMDAMMAGDLKDDFAPKYGEKGVELVTLTAQKPIEGLPSISVGKPKLAETLGEGRGPRVYVLNAAGKVVWFDLEYTLSTHRELHAALDELVAK